ncbi:hypothetical protein ACQ4M3_16305 [Leptolyngbya sp. AN03gr2]|uniref:hypothetical protein n=1 Tax=unclassified Leptolyngbya TaxID=2650499 RepID=UPI003D30FD1A
MIQTIPPAVRKQLGTQVMRVQRNFPYPIKNYIHCLPPIHTPTEGTLLVILTQHKTFVEALWTAYSWLKFLAEKPALRVVMDGDVTQVERRRFSKLFPNGTIESVEACVQYSAVRSYRAIDNFYRLHKFGKLLMLKLALQYERDILFSDPDVLVFQTPDEIIEQIKARSGCYFVEKNAFCVSDWIAKRAKQLSLSLTKNFNAGVLFIPQNSLSLELCNTLLEGWSLDVPDYFPEQTICDVLMTAANANPLPTESYVVNNQGMLFWEKDADYRLIKIRHFVGNVRHRMYLSGYPMIKQILDAKEQ